MSKRQRLLDHFYIGKKHVFLLHSAPLFVFLASCLHRVDASQGTRCDKVQDVGAQLAWGLLQVVHIF
jgi:hypothetical protein